MLKLTALVLTLPLFGCGMVGMASQRSLEAGGVAVTSVAFTPLVGFASWPLWNWMGGYASAWLTGTREVRVPTEEVGSEAPGGLSIPSPSEAILGGTGDTMLILLAIVAFIALGGPAWALKKISDARKEDATWTEALAKDRAAHAAETAALRAEVELLKRLVVGKDPPAAS